MLNRKKKMGLSGRVFVLFVAASLICADGVFSSVQAQDNASQNLDVTVQVEEDVPPASQLNWVQEQTVLVKQVFDRVKMMLDQARQEKDTLKITCLDDKFTQIHVSLRGVEERTRSLEISLKSGDVTTANQNFSILKIYISRIFGLNSEAENCLGESDVVLGKTETSTSISGDAAIIEILTEYNPDPGLAAGSSDQAQPTSNSVDPDGFDDVQQVLSASE